MIYETVLQRVQEFFRRAPAICVCIAASASAAQTDGAQADYFAAIALQAPAEARGGTEEKPAPSLPMRLLEADANDPGVPVPQYQPMDSAEELRAALEEKRREYAPFLEDHTPPGPQTRTRLDLDRFQLRMAAPEDKQDLGRVFRGEGAWETVSIPDFRGPAGWSTAYYRKVLDIPEAVWAQEAQILCFGAVCYSCKVYLNGRMLGAHTGYWAPFEIDVTGHLRRDGDNVLVVEVANEQPAPIAWGKDGRKLAAGTSPGWNDPTGWGSALGFGIWQACYLEGRPALHITDIFVQPNIDDGYVDLRIQVYQPDPDPRPLRLDASIYPKNFEGPGVEGIAIPTPHPAGALRSEYRARIETRNFRLWALDTPYLYTIRVSVRPEDGAGAADSMDAHFGMRTFTMDETGAPKGTFYLNNEEIILRGTNTFCNLLRPAIEGDFDQIVDDLLIGKLANLNFWRLTQQPHPPEVYDLCDRLGVLTQTDLPLIESLSRQALEEAIKQSGEMELLVRNHPCNVVVSFMNEPADAARKQTWHRHLTHDEMARFYEAASQVVKTYNPQRVIKPVDGDYDPPSPGLPDIHIYCMWYASNGLPIGRLHKGEWIPTKPGWKWGCGEYGAEGLVSAESMFKHYPADWLPESPDSPWLPDKIRKAQTWSTHGVWYDTQDTMREWVAASQDHQALATRMMTRAFRRQADMGSSAILYLIDHWPAGWLKALMDCDRMPKKAFFELREALTPLMVDIRTDRTRYYAGDRTALEFYVCNDGKAPFAEGTLVWEVWRGDERVFAQTAAVEIPSYDPAFAGFFHYQTPPVSERTPLSVRLALLAPDGNVVHASEQALEVFPPFDPVRNLGRTVVVAGAEGGRAWRLAEALGMTPEPVAAASPTGVTLLFVDSPEDLERASGAVHACVENGATALLLEQEAGAVWRVDGAEAKIVFMTGREFVSRKTGHPLVEGFQPFDFAYWYDPGVDRIEYVLDAVVEGQGRQVLSTVDWWTADKSAVVLDVPAGNGAFLISQLKAVHRVGVNPVAAAFFQRIVDAAYAREPGVGME